MARQVLPRLFAVVMAQQLLIAGLSRMIDLHWEMFRTIGEELEIDLPEQPPLADPAAMEKMAEGIRQLEAMFGFDKPDEPVN